MPQSQIVKTDVLVVGGGGAGFRAAISARKKGMHVTLLSKGPLARCGASPMAGADYTLDGHSMSKIDGLTGDKNDSPEKVFNDIVTQGCYLNNQKLVEQYIHRAPQCLKELLDWGIRIKLSDERMILTTGIGIMDALLKRLKSMNVELMEDIALLDLITHDGQCAGGLGLSIRTGEFIHFEAKAVVMATGGWHKAFWPNTGMRDLSGDGIAMAYRAGAQLGNMEFITFACNVFYSPQIWRGSIAAYMMGIIAHGQLTNINGEDFCKQYDPYLMDNAWNTEWNKCVISYASTKEVKEGRGLPNGSVYYGRGNVPMEIINKAADLIFHKWKYKAIDFSAWGKMLEENKTVEVGPAVEYFDGGIVVNDRFETSIPGLFAAGECTLGTFGSNRVFSAITEMLVHGADAGYQAGNFAAETKGLDVNPDVISELQSKAEAPFHKKGNGLKIAQIRRKIQKNAHKLLGPIRNKVDLESFLSIANDAKKNDIPNSCFSSTNRKYNKEWIDAIELDNMIQILEIAAHSALTRKESRGVHFREDYPDTDNNNWLKENIVSRANDSFQIDSRPVEVTSMSLPTGKIPYLSFIKQMMEEHSDTGGKH